MYDMKTVCCAPRKVLISKFTRHTIRDTPFTEWTGRRIYSPHKLITRSQNIIIHGQLFDVPWDIVRYRRDIAIVTSLLAIRNPILKYHRKGIHRDRYYDVILKIDDDVPETSLRYRKICLLYTSPSPRD